MKNITYDQIAEIAKTHNLLCVEHIEKFNDIITFFNPFWNHMGIKLDNINGVVSFGNKTKMELINDLCEIQNQFTSFDWDDEIIENDDDECPDWGIITTLDNIIDYDNYHYCWDDALNIYKCFVLLGVE